MFRLLFAFALLPLALIAVPAAAPAEPLIPVQLFGGLTIENLPKVRRKARSGDIEANFLLYSAYRKLPRHGAFPWVSNDKIASRAEAEAGLRAAAEAGHTSAMITVGAGLLYGDSLPRAPREAQGWFERLYEYAKGSDRAMVASMLAIALLDAPDPSAADRARALALANESLALGAEQSIVPKARAMAADDPAAARAMLDAAQGTNPHARLPLAQMLLTGTGGPVDVARAERLLAGWDSREALAERARQHLPGGAFPRLPQRALTLLAPMAAVDPDARQQMAELLVTYRASPKDAKTIFYRMQEDVDTGVAGAPARLVRLLDAKRDGFRDEKLWFELLRKYADSDPIIGVFAAHRDARFAIHSKGESAQRFADNVRRRLAKLESQGVAEAFTMHASLLQKGMVYAQDDVAAAQTFYRGAELGDTSAMVELGDAYDEGRGVPRDRATALAWFRAAASRGDRTGRARVARRFAFDTFNKQISLREGLTERIVQYGDGLSGPAMTSLTGMFSNPRLQDFTQADIANALLDGLRLSPGAVEEDKLVPLVRQVPQPIWAAIEGLLVENNLMQGPAQGFMRPAARDALRQWVYASGPPAE